VKAVGLCTGDKFALHEGEETGLVFQSWHVNGYAVCMGFPDNSGYGRAFEVAIDHDTEIHLLATKEGLLAAHAALKPFIATLKESRTTHEITGYAPSLDRAEEIIQESFAHMPSYKYLGVRWE
jgi:hypothetical protein